MTTPRPAGEITLRPGETPFLERTMELPIVRYDSAGNPIQGIVPTMDGFSAGVDALSGLGASNPALGGGVYGNPVGSFRVGTYAVPTDVPLVPVAERQNFFGVVDSAEANFSIARLPEGQNSAGWGHTGVPVSVVALEGNPPNAAPGSGHFMVSVRFRIFGEGYADVRMTGEQAQAMGINLRDVPRDGNAMSLLWQQRSLYAIEVTDRSASLAPEQPLPNDPMEPPPAIEANASDHDPIPQGLLFSTRADTGDRYCVLEDGVAAIIAPNGASPAVRTLRSSLIPGAQTWVLENARWNGHAWEGGHWEMLPPGSDYALGPQQVFAIRNPLGETRAYQLGPDGNSRIPREFH